MYIRYLTPAHQDILIKPLLTVPDAPDGEYQFAGVPDGLGVFVLPGTDGTFELVVTHELRYNAGKRRAHACSGAFVSRWTIDTTHWNQTKAKGRIGVVTGRDQIRCVHHWVHQSEKYRTSKSVPIERLCSADLPAPSALFFEADGEEFGTQERIFLGAEETHTRYKNEHGRAFAHILTGPREGHTYELPHLGRGSFENALACPIPQKKTIIVLPDDAESHRVYGEPGDKGTRVDPDPCAMKYDHYHPPSEVYVYVGEKQTRCDAEKSTAPELTATGLVGGTLYGVQVMRDGAPIKWEHREYGFGTDSYVGEAEFRLINLGDRSKPVPMQADHAVDEDGCQILAQDNPGIALQRDSIENGITQFLRPEDGAWDPRQGRQNEFYFGTTDSFDGNSRLFRLVFNDIETVGDTDEVCGTIEILLNARKDSTRKNGEYLFHSLDSITVDPLGRVLVQEDPGGETYFTRTLLYLPDEGRSYTAAKGNPPLYAVAEGNPDVFGRRGSHFLTIDEEAAGIIPVFDLLGEGWYLTAIQANVEEDWANKVLPSLLSFEEQVQLETDLVTPGQLCAMFIPKDITSRKDFQPIDSVAMKDNRVCAGHSEEYAGRKYVSKIGD
jgi:hypothetical protein